MLVIELVSKLEVCWALWKLVVFDPVDNPTRLDSNNVACFLMGDFLRLGPVVLMDKPPRVRGQRSQENFLAHFVAHCESCVQDVENAVLVIRVCCCSF